MSSTHGQRHAPRLLVQSTIMLGAFTVLALSACDNTAPAGEGSNAAPSREAETQQPGVELRAALQIKDLGGDVTALLALPDRAQPRNSLILAARDGGGITAISLVYGETTDYDARAFSSLVAAGEFALRDIEAPLVAGVGPGMTAPEAYLFIPDRGGLVGVPSEPIAPDINAQFLCATGATDGALQFVVIGRDTAEEWRLLDTGSELLTAEKLRDRPDARGAQTCGRLRTPGGVVLAQGVQLDADGPVIGDVAPLPQRNGAGDAMFAFVAWEEQDFALIDAIDGDVITNLTIVEGVNVDPAPTSSAIAVDWANFGGSFSGGVIALAHDDRVSVLALDRALSAAGVTPSP